MKGTLRFRKAKLWWWRKQLVSERGVALPVQLAVLRRELSVGEQGVWMNARERTSGIVELRPYEKGGKPHFRPRREALPFFVASKLEAIYVAGQVAKGCPDLVIWREDPETVKLVDVRGPDWKETTKLRRTERERFIEAAARLQVPTRIVMWRVADGAA